MDENDFIDRITNILESATELLQLYFNENYDEEE